MYTIVRYIIHILCSILLHAPIVETTGTAFRLDDSVLNTAHLIARAYLNNDNTFHLQVIYIRESVRSHCDATYIRTLIDDTSEFEAFSAANENFSLGKALMTY